MSSGLSRQAMFNRMNHAIREKVEKRAQEQRRSLMYLVADFLNQQGLLKTFATLSEEAQLSSNYEVCDNVDLQIILTEYTDYYHSRFQKWPQICKQVENASPKDSSSVTNSGCQKENRPKPKSKDTDEVKPSLSACSGLTVTPLSQKDAVPSGTSGDADSVFHGERVLRPLGNLYPAGSEWKEIAEVITREIVTTDLNVHWEDVYGLDEGKRALKEAIVYPMKYSEYFSSPFRPSKGVLLYGPPGTGKTMLAKVIATECDFTFFNITASSLVSKWRGDSEKYVRVLFELARYHAPSVIFIDEIDWIAAGDGACGSDKSEPARRFRAELLARLDGLMSENDSRIVLLAATNAPWSLDSALLRRLETHINVDVPNYETREKILKDYTEVCLHNTVEFKIVVNRTDGYSSADLRRLCREAWMRQMEPVWSKLETKGTIVRSVEMPKLVVNSTALLHSMDRVLRTAQQLSGRYEEWRNSMMVKI